MRYQLQKVTLNNENPVVVATSDEMDADDQNGLNEFFQTASDGHDLRDDQQWRMCTDSAASYVKEHQ